MNVTPRNRSSACYAKPMLSWHSVDQPASYKEWQQFGEAMEAIENNSDVHEVWPVKKWKGNLSGISWLNAREFTKAILVEH